MATNLPPLPPGFQLESGTPPPPAGFQVQASQPTDPAQIDRVSQLLAQAKAIGNDEAASHFEQWLSAHNAQPTAPNAQTQAINVDNSATLAASNPALGNGVGGSLAGAGLGFIHHAANIPIGAAQLATNVAAGAGDLVGAHGLDNAAAGINQYVKNREQNYQDVTKGNVGSDVGAVAGEVAPWVVGLGAARAAGAIPEATSTLGKVGALAAEGGAMGATQPVAGDGSFAGTKAEQIGLGAATGPVLYGAGRLVGGVADAAGHVFNPQSVADANIARLYGSTPDVLAKLDQPRQLVAGEQPTTAQVLQNPQSVIAERVLRNRAPQQFAELDVANNQARTNALQDVAGNQDMLLAAKAARTADTQPYRDNVLAKVNVKPAPVVETLTTIAKNPNRSAAGAADQALATIQRNMQPDGTVPADVLDGIRQESGDYLARNATNSVVGSKENAIYGPVSTQIAKVLDANAPGYSDYLAAYAKHSEPINTMEQAQKLLDPNAPGGPNSAGTRQLTLAKLQALLRQDDKARYPISPAARSQLEAVRDSLQREAGANARTGTAAGSQTAANLQADGFIPSLVFGSNLGAKGAPLGRAIGGVAGLGLGGLMGGYQGAMAGGILGGAAGDALGLANQRVIDRIVQGAANPDEARAAIQRYLATQNKSPNALQKLFFGTQPNQLQTIGAQP